MQIVEAHPAGIVAELDVRRLDRVGVFAAAMTAAMLMQSLASEGVTAVSPVMTGRLMQGGVVFSLGETFRRQGRQTGGGRSEANLKKAASG
jgi:hypothetical protein